MDNELTSQEVNFAKGLGRIVILCAAVPAAWVVGKHVGYLAVETIDSWRDNRKAKKAETSVR